MIAEGGAITDHALADLWWRRLHAGEPTPGPAPTLQVMATPSKLRAGLSRGARRGRAGSARRRARTSRASMPTAPSCSSRSRRDGVAADDATAARRARRGAAGGWLLGARAMKLDAYLRSLRDALDPHRIMNPGTLA